MNCYAFPFLILLILGNILLISLGVVLPAYILYILYQPKVIVYNWSLYGHLGKFEPLPTCILESMNIGL